MTGVATRRRKDPYCIPKLLPNPFWIFNQQCFPILVKRRQLGPIQSFCIQMGRRSVLEDDQEAHQNIQVKLLVTNHQFYFHEWLNFEKRDRKRFPFTAPNLWHACHLVLIVYKYSCSQPTLSCIANLERMKRRGWNCCMQ